MGYKRYNTAPKNWKFHFWKYLCPSTTPIQEIKKKLEEVLAKPTYTDGKLLFNFDNAACNFLGSGGEVAAATTTNSIVAWTESNWSINPYSYKAKLPKGDRVTFKLKNVGKWYILQIWGNYELLEKVKYSDFYFEVYVDNVKQSYRCVSALSLEDAKIGLINKFIKERNIDKDRVMVKSITFKKYMDEAQSFS
jgi:hypothetical protein